jgi:hypothetical protein
MEFISVSLRFENGHIKAANYKTHLIGKWTYVYMQALIWIRSAILQFVVAADFYSLLSVQDDCKTILAQYSQFIVKGLIRSHWTCLQISS